MRVCGCVGVWDAPFGLSPVCMALRQGVPGECHAQLHECVGQPMARCFVPRVVNPGPCHSAEYKKYQIGVKQGNIYMPLGTVRPYTHKHRERGRRHDQPPLC
jgi:hypothetical protein